MKTLRSLALAVLLIVPSAITNVLKDGPGDPPQCPSGQNCTDQSAIPSLPH